MASKTEANKADFLGQGGTYENQKAPTQRATTPDGLFYLDTGEPTPLYIQRQQLAAGIPSYAQQQQAKGAESIYAFDPSSDTSGKLQYKYDPQRGQYYTEGTGGKRTYISNSPAGKVGQSDTPLFTVNMAPKAVSAGGVPPALTNAAYGAALGAKGGPAGAAVGAGLGALTGLPPASGRQLYLTAGDPNQVVGQRKGTPAEAAAANYAFQTTGVSTPVGGFPVTPGPAYQPTGGSYMPTNYATNQGSNNAISQQGQQIIANAQQMAQQSQTRANDFYSQAAAAGSRAAPQMALPSSANQQAVYDRAMGFNAQSGADAIRAARADISGATRLENYQLDQQGINNLEGFQSSNTAQGVNALYGFRPDETFRSANQLENFYAQNTAEGANAVQAFNPDMVQQDAESLRNFKADRSGIDRLNAYADEAQGPSAAQAMLRAQADADKRTQLAIARSGRGGPAASVAAQRQAISEGGLIEAETRGQGAALAAQETEAYKQRQLQALAQAGSLISTAEAQRLTALSNAGALMSQADQQKLQALVAYGELKATQDSQQLSARQSAGQLNASAEGMLLNATSNAAQLQNSMDAQRLAAIGQAAQLRTQGDVIRSNNLQAAGQIRLSGSEINQRGAIAASAADLQAQALNLNALSLAGNISTEIRNQDINVLRSNLDAQLQTLGLNDQQVRFFNQLGSDREVASQNLQQQASALGLNATQAQEALNLQWQQFGLSALSQQQQYQYQQQLLAQNGGQFDQQMALQQQQFAAQQAAYNQQQQRAQQQQTLNTLGTIFQGASALFNSPSAPQSSASAVAGTGFQPGLGASGVSSNPVGIVNQGGYQQVFDPFTNQWVTRAAGTPGNQVQSDYSYLAGSGGTSYGI